MEQVAKNTWLVKEKDHEKQSEQVRQILAQDDAYIMVHLTYDEKKEPIINLISALPMEHVPLILESLLGRVKAVMPGASN